jgi:hypothetical protein
MPIIKKCIECGREMKIPPSCANKIKTCSKECRSKNRTGAKNPRSTSNNWLNQKCKGCGKLFHVKPSAKKNGKSKTYCSADCRNKHLGQKKLLARYAGSKPLYELNNPCVFRCDFL